jgi:3-(3-hydroxy-phenyl)propionate hydroxylase
MPDAMPNLAADRPAAAPRRTPALPTAATLLDRAGSGLTAILFCEGQPTDEQAALLAQLARIDKRFVSMLVTSRGPASEAKIIADSDGEIARLLAAAPGTLYLLRPDLHIAGRWKAVIPGEILKTASLCLGSETP